jgi:hypothetical protein
MIHGDMSRSGLLLWEPGGCEARMVGRYGRMSLRGRPAYPRKVL